jgi:hypothetical protein
LGMTDRRRLDLFLDSFLAACSVVCLVPWSSPWGYGRNKAVRYS